MSACNAEVLPELFGPTNILTFERFSITSISVFFNFTLWGALMSTTGVSNPDILVNRFPNPETAVSLVYASKLVILIFAMSSYSVFFLHRLEMALHFKSERVN